MKVKSSLLSFVIVFMLIYSLPTCASAAPIKVGVSAVAKYAGTNCGYYDIVTDVYASKFLSQITQTPTGGTQKATEWFKFFNSDAWECDLKNNSNYDHVDDVDFMLFAGHGFRASLGFSTYNAAHYSTDNGNPHPVNSEKGVGTNFEYNEAYWGSPGTQTKWVTMYTCNFLNYETKSSSGQTLSQWGRTNWAIMDGLHMLLGYGTQMYITAAEGDLYGLRLFQGKTIQDAFFEAAQTYQPNNSKDVIARIIYADGYENETISNYSQNKPYSFRNTNGGGYWIKSSFIESAGDWNNTWEDPRI